MPDNSMPIGLTPYITVHDAAAALAFYTAAFGGRELQRNHAPNSQKIMHARIEILGSILMLADDFPEFMHGKSRAPQSEGVLPLVLSLQVEDAEATWQQALAAGATAVMPLKDQFWGARYGQLRDPFGYNWSISQTLPPMSEDEMRKGAEAAFQL